MDIRQAMTTLDYDRAPFLAIWETTQACDLACKHCRASAQPLSHPSQLTTAEATNLIDQIAELEVPLFVFTGGDPLKRPDIFQLIRHAASKGVHAALTPSATPLLTREAIFRMKEAGLSRLAVSLDGSVPEIHDSIRGIPGTWERTLEAIGWANEAKLPIQVHTVVSRLNIDDLDKLAVLLTQKQIVMWSFFFLVPVGRGKTDDLLTGEEFEAVFAKMWELTKRVPFAIKTTEAPSYRRVALNHMRENGWTGAEIEKTPVYRGFGIRDGHGIMFVSNQGDIYPAGFLPLVCGNVRETALVDVYRDSPLFRSLHNPATFRGKCGVCEFRTLCGGSRARAFAYTGDPLGSDPFCAYEPRISAANHTASEAAQSILAGAY